MFFPVRETPTIMLINKRIQDEDVKSEELRLWIAQSKKKSKLKRKELIAVNAAKMNKQRRVNPTKPNWNFKPIALKQKLYIIGCREAFKVGISTNPYKRLTAIQTGNPAPCRILAIWEPRHAASVERKVHQLLKKHKISGEWFAIAILTHAYSQITSLVGLPVLSWEV